jgi:hypothetical protein
MYHSPLTLYEPENLGHKTQNTLLLSSKSGSHKTLRVGPTGRYTRSQNSELNAFQLYLATAYADRSACSVTKECCTIQPYCC